MAGKWIRTYLTEEECVVLGRVFSDMYLGKPDGKVMSTWTIAEITGYDRKVIQRCLRLVDCPMRSGGQLSKKKFGGRTRPSKD